jgi:hypothetical protein
MRACQSELVQRELVDTPTSYLAVNELLSRLIADNPFARPSASMAGYTQQLPQTDLVSENEGTTVMLIGQQYMMRTADGGWSPWDSANDQ